MSVTLANGGKQEKRRELDFYPTPAECTIALCEFLKDEGAPLIDLTCLEPACGEGHMSDVLEKYFRNVYSSDIRDTGYGQQLNYLNEPNLAGDCLITNPPFNESEAFIRKAISEGRSLVGMLLKSQYWHSAKRLKLFNEHPPAYVLPLTWRADFLFNTRQPGDKINPTMEVLWTVWHPEYQRTVYQPLKKPKMKG